MAKTNNPEAEQWILGTLIFHPESIVECQIEASDFSQASNRVIFEAITEVQGKGIEVDILTVAQAVEAKHGVVDMAYIGELASQASGSPANMAYYCKFLRQASRLRKARDIAEEIRFQIEHADDAACENLIDDSIQRLMSIDMRKTGYEHTLNESLTSTLEKLDYLNNNRDQLPGISTGITRLDDATGGFRAKKLYVIGARPSGGKTALMMNFVSSAAAVKISQGIFSAEMDHEELSSRLISIYGAINSFKMTTGRFDEEDWARLTSAVSVLRKNQVMINDEPSISITQLMRQARIWKKRHGIKIIFVDYIQLLRSSNPRHQTTERVTEVVQGLKQLSRELDLPVVALAQLNREADDLGRPAGLKHFADASAIEKDANFAATLFADEAMEQTNQLLIHVCKNRDGPKGDIPVNYQRPIYRITNPGNAGSYGAG